MPTSGDTRREEQTRTASGQPVLTFHSHRRYALPHFERQQDRELFPRPSSCLEGWLAAGSRTHLSNRRRERFASRWDECLGHMCLVGLLLSCGQQLLRAAQAEEEMDCVTALSYDSDYEADKFMEGGLPPDEDRQRRFAAAGLPLALVSRVRVGRWRSRSRARAAHAGFVARARWHAAGRTGTRHRHPPRREPAALLRRAQGSVARGLARACWASSRRGRRAPPGRACAGRASTSCIPRMSGPTWQAATSRANASGSATGPQRAAAGELGANASAGGPNAADAGSGARCRRRAGH
jgi:hypothetical protein